MREIKFDYFNKFRDMARKASEASGLLQSTLNEFDPATVEKKTEAMKRIENDCDQIMHEIMNRLAIEFLPPIAREDIIEITEKLDTVVDHIEDVLLGIYMYRIRTLLPETLEFVELIVEATGILEEVVLEFSNFKRSNDVKKKIIQINALEGRGDTLYLNAMRELFSFSGSFDARQIIVWKEMLTVLEECLDRVEECANEFESAMLKNA